MEYLTRVNLTEWHRWQRQRAKGRVRKVILENGEVFEAGHIIVAAGYESRYIVRFVGIDV